VASKIAYANRYYKPALLDDALSNILIWYYLWSALNKG